MEYLKSQWKKASLQAEADGALCQGISCNVILFVLQF